MPGARKPVLFPATGVVFAPSVDRGFFHRYRITSKRCVESIDRVLLESLVIEHDDGRTIGQTWAFQRAGGHLEGGLYRRYPAVIERIPCPWCQVKKGELCIGGRGRWWGGVHWCRRETPPGKIRSENSWRAVWKAIHPELGIHEVGL